MVPIKNCLKQGGNLSPLLFNFVLDYAIKRAQVNQDSLKENRCFSAFGLRFDVLILGGIVHTIK